MAWDRLKRFLGRQEENAPQTPDGLQERFAQNPPDFSDISWIEAADNAWGVRVLDVRPFTLNMLSTSADPQCASNAVSFLQDDGTSFIGEDPPSRRIAEASLCFPIDRILADGVLFISREEARRTWFILPVEE